MGVPLSKSHKPESSKQSSTRCWRRSRSESFESIPEPPEVEFFFSTNSDSYHKDGQHWTDLHITLISHGPEIVTIWPQDDILNLPYALETSRYLVKYVDVATDEIINEGGIDNSILDHERVEKEKGRPYRMRLVSLEPHVPTILKCSLRNGWVCQNRMQSGHVYEITADGDQIIHRWAIGRPDDVVNLSSKALPGYSVLAKSDTLKPITLKYNQRNPALIKVR